jgi:dipeptidase
MRTKTILFSLALMLTAILFAGAQAYDQYASPDFDEGECTALIIGKLASTDGSVMTSHTCDGNYNARLTVVPGGKHKADEKVTIVKDLLYADNPSTQVTVRGEIPQVETTYTYFQIAYPFMNEHQVMIGETTFGGRAEMRNPAGMFFIEQLEAIALQRGQTAREVVQIMGALAEKYGYADGGECLTVTDANEGWVFECVGAGPLWTKDSGKPGAVWVAARVPDDKVFVSANRARIGELDLKKPDWYMASPNVYDLAKDMGFWDGKATFRFWEVYAPKDNPYNSRREWRVYSTVAPSNNYDPWARRYPFAVKPDKKVSVQSVMALYRDHYEGTEFDLTKGPDAGPFGNPNRWATRSAPESGGWERAISMFRCSYCFVSQSRSWLPDAIGGVLWFGEDAPHATVYMPIYAGTTELPASLAVESRFEFSRNSAWWAFNFVENWSNLSYSYIIQDIKARQAKYEGEFFAMQSAVEGAAAALYAQNPDLAKTYLTRYTNDSINRVVSGWWSFADELVAKYGDGYIWSKTKGYPEDWLKFVNYGESAKFSKYKDLIYPDQK